MFFGGLEYPEDDENKKMFLKLKKNIIDFYIYKEGELAFLNLLKALKNNDFNVNKIKKNYELDGIHYVRPSGKYFCPPCRTRKKFS